MFGKKKIIIKRTWKKQSTFILFSENLLKSVQSLLFLCGFILKIFSQYLSWKLLDVNTVFPISTTINTDLIEKTTIATTERTNSAQRKFALYIYSPKFRCCITSVTDLETAMRFCNVLTKNKRKCDTVADWGSKDHFARIIWRLVNPVKCLNFFVLCVK